ncbi:MAG: rod shape-determining protein [Synergistetes bacterium]|nr:rod shape-determining protein [Synergistota bacterium]MDW8191967.1 rod shape-determining protein [Synergistota bacterium]
MFDFIAGLFSKDMGIDLGTAYTVVYVRGKGIVISEPSVVAIQKATKEIIAVGEEAKKMVGKTPQDIEAIKPMRNGVIADFDVTKMMLRYFMSKVHGRKGMFKPRVIVCVPSGITEVERRAVVDATLQAGAREAYLIEEPLAAAIGAGLPIHEPRGNMVLDIGGGRTEVAVISLGGIVVRESIKVAGDEMDNAIMEYMNRVHELVIGEQMAENIKKTIGNVDDDMDEVSMEVKGRDLRNGVPRVKEISSSEIREVLKPVAQRIIEAVRAVLEQTPPELSADIIDRGIVMTGGTSLLKGLDKMVSKGVGVPAYLSENPMYCVALGAGKVLEELDTLRRVLLSIKRGEE